MGTFTTGRAFHTLSFVLVRMKDNSTSQMVAALVFVMNNKAKCINQMIATLVFVEMMD